MLFHSIEIELETMVTQYDITVSWNNPFTSDLSFCVDAKPVKSSGNVVSECVSGTRYVFTSLDSDLCEDLSFTVTPTVTVEGVQMNGTSSKPVVGYFHGRRGTIMIIYIIYSTKLVHLPISQIILLLIVHSVLTAREFSKTFNKQQQDRI